MNKNNNIFTYATSELSQDAFLCWLFSYAMKDADDEPVLKECAIDFLKLFIDDIKDGEVWVSEKPIRQHESIDVLLTVNDRYKVIIEDKTGTDEHDNQLNRYFKIIENEFEDYIPVGVYYKTGFQSDLSTVINSNYKYIGRKSILSILEKYITKTDNLILLSYYENVKHFDDTVNKYKTLPLCDWDWEQINGFFDFEQKSFEQNKKINCNYDYINPPAGGGFYGMWLYDSIYREYCGNKYELYLQCVINNSKLEILYKISSLCDVKIKGDVRDFFVWKNKDNKWVDIAKEYGFLKPKRYGSGKTVTLGVYPDTELINDYKSASEKIDMAVDAFLDLVNALDELNVGE